MEYEYDPEVPYWRADIEVQALFDTYAPDGALTMRGRFLPLLTNTQTYCNTFTPGAGTEEAIVVPIYANGRMVDILALSADDVAVWGCVTGKGTVAGTIPDGQPVRVYEAPWRWQIFDCDGVVILAKSAFPGLASASEVYAESLDHADDLAERVFLSPVLESPEPTDRSARLIAAENAELEARDRIHIDEERYDVEEEILQRAVISTVVQLRTEGNI